MLRYDRVFSRLPKKIGSSLILRISWAVLNYLGILVLARVFTPTEYGVFALAVTIAALGGTIANIGTQNAMIRFVAQYRANGDREREKGALYSNYSIVSYSCLVTMFLCLSGIWGLASIQIVSHPLELSIGLLMLPGFSILDTQAAAARSYGSVFWALAPRDVIWRAFLIIAAFVFSSGGFSTSSRLMFFLIAAGLFLNFVLLIQRLAIERMLPGDFAAVQPVFSFSEWRKVAFPLWISAIASTALRTFDVLVLSAFLEPAELGGYFAASRLAMLTQFVHQTLNIVAGPQIAQKFHEGKKGEMQQALGAVAATAFIPGLSILIVYLLFGEMILSIVSSDFVWAYGVLIVLSVGNVFSTFCGSSTMVLNLTGHERANLSILVTTALPGVLLTILAAGMFGGIGAALAVAGWQAVLNIRQWIYARSSIGVEPTVIAALTHRAPSR